MKRVFIPFFGYHLIETKNPFRKKKMEHAQMREYFGGCRTRSQETDLN
jgi:hypothetical protein